MEVGDKMTPSKAKAAPKGRLLNGTVTQKADGTTQKGKAKGRRLLSDTKARKAVAKGSGKPIKAAPKGRLLGGLSNGWVPINHDRRGLGSGVMVKRVCWSICHMVECVIYIRTCGQVFSGTPFRGPKARSESLACFRLIVNGGVVL